MIMLPHFLSTKKANALLLSKVCDKTTGLSCLNLQNVGFSYVCVRVL